MKGAASVGFSIEYSLETDRNGQPIAAVVTMPNIDAETAALSQNPQFLAIMERSRIRYAQEGGISSADMRKRLGLAPTQDDSPAAD